ncbi:MAG: hypothetical protein AB7H96_24735 [Vicinamibacterales bacterium]
MHNHEHAAGPRPAGALINDAMAEVSRLEEERATLTRGLEAVRQVAGGPASIDEQLDSIAALKLELERCDRDLERARERVTLVMDAALPAIHAERRSALEALEPECRAHDAEFLASCAILEGLPAEFERRRAEVNNHHADVLQRGTELGRRREALTLSGGRPVTLENPGAAVEWKPPSGVLVSGTAWRRSVGLLRSIAGVQRATLVVDETSGEVRRIMMMPGGTWVLSSDGAFTHRQPLTPESSSPALAVEIGSGLHRREVPSRD